MRVKFIIGTDIKTGKIVGRMSYGNLEDAMGLRHGAEVLRPDWVAFANLLIKVI